MAYNRYMGNGKVVRMPDAPSGPRRQSLPAGQPLSRTETREMPMKKCTAPLIPGLGGEVSRLLGGLKKPEWETEDLLLALILYLAYRESGDRELLIILGAMLFL